MRLSHDQQHSFGDSQLLVRTLELACESDDLGLFGGELADLLVGLLTVENAGVVLFAPSLISEEYRPSRRRYAPPPLLRQVCS
ncbi:hypothetical protein AXA44_36615 [Rhodococcus sp. SC4]|nr:hypothetical protein AXA44_36615 [Rhodococcus sp. SC4]